jgi:hypothetical protein
VRDIGGWAFADCQNLKSITFGQGLKAIRIQAFAHCKNLTSVTIPDNVKTIGVYAFHGCESLQNITIPDSVNQSYEQAFDPHTLALIFLLDALKINDERKQKLKKQITAKKFRTKFILRLIERNEVAAICKLFSLVKKMPPEEIDLYIEKAANNAEIRVILLNHKKLLYSPEILEQIEAIQVEKDFGLREKTLADYRKDFTVAKKGDLYILSHYKSENPNVVIPGNIQGRPVQFIEKTFKNKDFIQTVIIEDGITEIVDHAFSDCMNLQNITIPASVTVIGENIFHYKQKSVTISAPADSTAAEYAKKNQINLQII